MPEENTTTVALSEQTPVTPVTESPSQQGTAAEGSAAPAPAVKPETAPAIDLEAIRKQALVEARERARREAASEYNKKLSEERRKVQEVERQQREQLLAGLSEYVPDTQLEALKGKFTAQQTSAELEQVKAQLAEREQRDQYTVAWQEAVNRAATLAEKAGYNISELPTSVRGEQPFGFEERFLDFIAEDHKKFKKQADAEKKKAAEEATRETERRLGVTTVTGGAPVGSGKTGLVALTEQMADAAKRGDRVKVKELHDAIYKEAGIGR